ncbi:MAG: hypothetical protein ACJAR1_001596 [Rubritalea sp.]|jgi:hypothetical protein
MKFIIIFSFLCSFFAEGKIIDFSKDFQVVAFVVKGKDGEVKSIHLLKGKKDQLNRENQAILKLVINQKCYDNNNYFMIMLSDEGKFFFSEKALDQETGKKMEEFYANWLNILDTKVRAKRVSP